MWKWIAEWSIVLLGAGVSAIVFLAFMTIAG